MTYRWARNASPADSDVAPIPARLQSYLQPSKGQVDRKPTVDEWAYLLGGVDKGARNDAVARIAGRFLSRGFTTSETVELLLLWNSRNRPPLEKQELVRTVLSIASREIRRIQG
jgi:hypothetical protein